MRTRKIFPLFIAALLVAGSGYAQDTYKPTASKMTVTGSSTLHEWTSEVSQVDWSGLITLTDNKLEAKNLVITIPVKSIKSTHGKMMDNKTYEAFRYEKNPTIIYKITGTQTKESDKSVLEATGTLTMAGVTKAFPVQVKSKSLPNGTLVLTGSRKIKMTDFNMDPPTAMMGTINVGEEVTVNFEVTLTAIKI